MHATPGFVASMCEEQHSKRGTLRGPLSDATQLLLRRVLDRPEGWRADLGRGEVVSMIEQIGRSGEPLAAPALLGFAFEEHESVSRAASCAIHALLAEVPPLDLASLDPQARRIGPFGYGRTWQNDIRPDDVLAFDVSAGTSPFVLGLASSHPSGYVREAAARSLARVSSGDEVPFLLIRANDWVERVREVAQQALRVRVAEGQVRAFVRSLPLVSWLRRCGRSRHAPFTESVEQLIGQRGTDEELFEGIRSRDGQARRACARIAGEYERLQLCRRALTTSDSIVRLFAAELLMARLPASEASQLSRDLANDRFMPIRREALRAAVELGPDLYSRLETGLLDRGFAVRRLAAYYAAQQFDVDLADFYRKRLASSSGRVLGACIAGLGEHGRKEDSG